MKCILTVVALLAASQAFAQGNVCLTKQQNAASFAVAQEVGVAVQGAEVVSFEPGMWTEAMANNTGSDKITVRIGNRTNRGLTIKIYSVGAKQIGASDDCKILGIAEE